MQVACYAPFRLVDSQVRLLVYVHLRSFSVGINWNNQRPGNAALYRQNDNLTTKPWFNSVEDFNIVT